MLSFIRGLLRWLLIVLSLMAIWSAVHRWLWLQSLPRLSPARFCGNCLAVDVYVPIEFGLCGAVVILASLFRVSWRRSDILNWCIVGIGVLSTPLIIGLPVFALGFLFLIYEKLLPCSTAAGSSAQPPPPR